MPWGFAAGELVAAPDLAAALEPAARAFEAWEVTGEGAFASREGLAPVRAALPSFRLRVTYHARFRGVDLAAPDPAARECHVLDLQAQLLLARELGASAVVVHPGRRIRGLPDPQAEARCRASLAALARSAQDLGLELRVENMPRGPEELGQSAAALRDLAAPTTGAVCWDLGHARTYAEPADLGLVAPLVREVHVHDNSGRNDDHWPLSAASTWLAPQLRALGGPAVLATVEHRTVAQCLASLEAARGLLG